VSRRAALALFALCLGAFSYFYQAGGWNQNVRFDLVRAIVEDHSLRIDRFARNTGDLSKRGDHYYCDKAPGVSWLGVPPYAIAHAVAGAPPTPRFLAWTAWLSTVFAIALPSAIAVVCLAGLLGALGVSRGIALAIAAAWALATLAWPYSTVFYGHQLIAALLVIAFTLAVQIRRAGAAPSPGRLAAIGALLGAAVVVEYPAVLAGIAIAIYAAQASRWEPRALGAMVIAGLVPIAALAGYHAATFGGPFTLPYSFSTQPHRHMGWFMGLGKPAPVALWGILFSEYRGLFYSAPWLLAALPGTVQLYRRGRGAEATVAVVTFGLFVWLNASLVDWQGGWAMGARYLVPAIPFLVVLAAGVALPPESALPPIGRRVAWAVATAIVGYSAFLMLAGTAVKPEVPSHIRRPFQQYLLPQLYRGQLAVSNQGIDMAGNPPDGPHQAWNLGQKLGLRGGASLLPLAAWIALCGGLLIRERRA
jgi:hypothetical protein